MKKYGLGNDDSLIAKLLAAAYGQGSPSAQMMALFFARYFAITSLAQKLNASGVAEPRITRLHQEFVRVLAIYLKTLAQEAEKATRTGDAQFFRDFALAIEEQHLNSRGRDEVRTLLLMHHLMKKPAMTIGETETLLKDQLGRDINESNRRQIYRFCSELGIPLAKAKEGRPKKTATEN